jgi:hypothetical protein
MPRFELGLLRPTTDTLASSATPPLLETTFCLRKKLKVPEKFCSSLTRDRNFPEIRLIILF